MPSTEPSRRLTRQERLILLVLATVQFTSIVDFMVISVIGAIISSIVVGVITVAVAAYCARRSLDLDNVAAPIVTAAGDIATLPSLFLAAVLFCLNYITDGLRDAFDPNER